MYQTRYVPNNTMVSQLGFTLMELMIVMVIIGILASIIGGSFIQSKLKSRDGQRKNDLSQIQRSLEAYYNDHGGYPLASNDGKILGTPWGGVFLDTNTTVYMNQLPNDPKAPVIQFLYVTNAAKTKYQIFTMLENDKDDAINPGIIGHTCGTSSCNYGVSSTNTRPELSLN